MNERTKFELLSFAQDLSRIALSIHRGSLEAAKVFSINAQKYTSLQDKKTAHYIKKIVSEAEAKLKKGKLKEVDGEQYLVYSILIHNYVSSNLKTGIPAFARQ